MISSKAISIKNAFLSNLIVPIKAMRWRYFPLMMIYFSYGASTFSGIAVTFWVKDALSLTPAQLAAIAVWIALPWTIKMIFGQFADSISLFGSQRKIYVYFGAVLMAFGSLTLFGTAAEIPWLLELGTPASLYVFSMMITVIGVVMQDVIADTMTTEVIDREGKTEEEIKSDLGMVQILGRLSLSMAGFMVAGLGGWLAANFEYSQVFLMMLIIPVISIIGVSLVKLDKVPKKPINWLVLGGGISFALFSAFMGLSNIPFGQEIVVGVSLLVVCTLIGSVIKDIDASTKRIIIGAIIVIFMFRAVPSSGVGVQWWMIDDLGFDQGFFGVLAQIGATLAILGMWFFAKPITTKPVGMVLGWLTVIATILTLPIIGMYYGLHDLIGVSARTVAIVDTALESPFGQLSMIPMLTLIAIHAPKGNAATWFALMASLMNLALSSAAVSTKYLNMAFVIDRGSYENLGQLLITTTTIGFVVPLITIFLIMTPQGNKILNIIMFKK